MKHPRKKKLTEEELKRYEKALILWERGLKKETAELDAREAELAEREAEVGIFYVPEPASGAGDITLESMQAMYRESLRPSEPYFPPALIRKSIVFNDDGCTLTPEEFVTTIKPCCDTCYEGGTHQAGCARTIYLEVERIGSL